ncbi:MAG: DUF2019 domain-containing protein [Alphaproteobacteria bacterium]|nr:DUF2019 domain-containing protein [Alphaproteobacteria bacterium]
MMANLKDLSGEALRERYIDLAILMGEDGDNCLTRSYNRRLAKMTKIVDELWSRSAIDVLLPNLRHENPWVRYLSAANCWEVAPEQAEATLEEVGRIRYGVVGMDARMDLNLIRSGKAVLRRPSQAS